MSTESYASDLTFYTTDADPGGRAEFTKNGDIFKVCDIEEDGWAVSGAVYDGNASPVSLPIYWIHAGGKGNCTTAFAGDGGSHNLPEGKTYKLEVCLYHGSETNYCRRILMYNNG
ncbi:hypothetical protein [Streptomyces sp. x-19]|uniref:hypothetical protein n=1 Tax=Streptomyces sp. x-19 TaxID=2789280 RepID=UPI0039805D15